MKQSACWMLFIFSALVIFQHYYYKEQMNKGRSISRFIEEHHQLTVPPAEARWFTVVVTTYDIKIEDMDVLMTLQNCGKETK